MRSPLTRLRSSLAVRRSVAVPGADVGWHSVSSCREYELCPRRYRFAYVERLRPDRLAPEAWRYGTVVHSALEAAYRAQAAGASARAREKTALAALREGWAREELPTDGEWPARAAELVRRTLAAHLLQDRHILGVEYRFGAQYNERVAFAGHADLLLQRDKQTVEIVDHKITSNVRDRRELQHDEQLNLYGWLAQQEWPWARRVLATHHYPPAATTVTVELTDESMASTMRDLEATARRAAADVEFRPNPGAHCGHCPWVDRCPDAISVDDNE